MSAPAPTSQVAVHPIDSATHLAYLRSLRSASFLQTPAWGRVKTDWRAESLGWYDADRLVGVGLVLHRAMPMIGRSLAYLPEGPLLDWASPAVSGDLARWLDPLVARLRAGGAFAVRMGPPVVTRRWQAATVKRAIADPVLTRLGDVPADSADACGDAVVEHLRRTGWRLQTADGGFSTGQPRHVFQVRLEGRDEHQLLAGMNQQWRRNIKKAAKAGVTVREGDRDELT
ncbi:MAG: aminoacyltransferase, partial [Actinomycetota bacterium]|nr:aminoacyltransferase [Actinomycetota bacterium]